MKINQAVGYAIAALTVLATADSRRPISCRAICEQTSMPERFLLQVLRSLVTAGLVVSTRGVRGGYCLAKSPSQITLLQVMGAINGQPPSLKADFKGLNADSQRLLNNAFLGISEDSAKRLSSLKLSMVCK